MTTAEIMNFRKIFWLPKGLEKDMLSLSTCFGLVYTRLPIRRKNARMVLYQGEGFPRSSTSFCGVAIHGWRANNHDARRSLILSGEQGVANIRAALRMTGQPVRRPTRDPKALLQHYC
jgi:hypothetical protein